MKVTLEISDPLLRQARRLSMREGLTLSALVERALRLLIDEASDLAPFKLRRAAFRGKGLQAEFSDTSWETIRETSYEGPQTTHET